MYNVSFYSQLHRRGIFTTAVRCRYVFKEKAMIDKDHGILPDASAEGPPFDTLV
jgi:hypothetical protein